MNHDNHTECFNTNVRDETGDARLPRCFRRWSRFALEAMKPRLLFVQNVPNAFAQILFMSGWRPGLALAAIAIVNWKLFLTGMVALGGVFLFCAFADLKDAWKLKGYQIYNPVLSGMAVGAIYGPTVSGLTLALIAGLVSLFLSVMLKTMFDKYSLPVLSLPFGITAVGGWLIFAYQGMEQQAIVGAGAESYAPSTTFLDSLLNSFGSILFMPTPSAGFIVLVVLFLFSRIMAASALLAFVVGVATQVLMTGDASIAVANPYLFNCVLTGIALCGVFTNPGVRGAVVGMVGVVMTVALIQALSCLGIFLRFPLYTLPFNLAVIPFLFVLRQMDFQELSTVFSLEPERAVAAVKLYGNRFGNGIMSIGLPFKGNASVLQGFDGQWTHKDHLRHAYDFVRKTTDGRLCENEGENLTDYPIYGVSVVSPVRGRVVACLDTLPDSPLGKPNRFNNWGNYVLIQSMAGPYVEISHLQPNSLKVGVGDVVEMGQELGLCGNSGFSYFPHIHVQVQKTGYLGDTTIPFNFSMIEIDGVIRFHCLPDEKMECANPEINLTTQRTLSLILGTVMRFEIFKDGRWTDKLIVKVGHDSESPERFYFEDVRKGGKLHFMVRDGLFTFYSPLECVNSDLIYFYLAFPRLPLLRTNEYAWKDYVPFEFFHSTLLNELNTWRMVVGVHTKSIEGCWRFDRATGLVKGEITTSSSILPTSAAIDELYGIREISVGTTRLVACG